MGFFDDLEFVNSGFVHGNAGKACDRVFDGYYGIQFILRGKIFVQVEDEKPWIGSGPLVFFTAPGKKFTYYCPSGTRDHLFLCFRGERVQRYVDGGLIPSELGKNIPVTAPEELVKLFSSALLTLRKKNYTSHGEAVLKLERLLLAITCQPKNWHKSSTFSEFIKSLEDEIADQPGLTWDFASIAAEKNISEVHFRRLFVNETGIPPWKYVLNCRIRYACQLLHSSPPLLIKEIASICGFSSEFNFSKTFRKIVKLSPEEFRKRI